MNIQVPTSTLDRVPAALKSWLSKPRPMLIDGKWVEAKSGKFFDVFDPATEMRLASVAEGDAADIDAAVKAARRAFEGPWSRMTPSARGRIIHKIGDLILEHLDELAQLESLDNGKPFNVARVADVPLSADMFHYMSGWATKIEGKHIALSHLVSPGEYLSYTRPEPIGVVGQIIPWNFPLLMAAWKLGPALATGCTIVLKVAEETPLSGLRLAAGRPSAGGQGRFHRLHRGRQAHCQGGRQRPEKGDPRAGRQVAQHHPGGCGSRYRDSGRSECDLFQ